MRGDVGAAAALVRTGAAAALADETASGTGHHKRMTFKEEHLEFLKRHEIGFDPRYVFE